MRPIPIPKELVNDDAYLLVALLADPESPVTTGQPLAELETSKAAFTLSSPADGLFRPDFRPGDMVPVSAVFGHIADPAAEPTDAPAPPKPAPQRDARFSQPAWDLFRASGLPAERFAHLPLIKKADVEAALNGRTSPAAIPPDAPPDGVVLLGGGGHCRELIELVELAGQYGILGIIDTYAAPGSLLDGHPVLGNNEYLATLRRMGKYNLLLSYGIAGRQAERGRHFRALRELGHIFPLAVHPRATVSRHAELGPGTQVMTGAAIGSGCRLGDVCLVNTNAVVSHGCRLGANVHIAPGALLAGGVTVGDDSVVGMGATVYMRVSIGRGVIIYNGVNVFADVPDGEVVKKDWNIDKEHL